MATPRLLTYCGVLIVDQFAHPLTNGSYPQSHNNSERKLGYSKVWILEKTEVKAESGVNKLSGFAWISV